MNRIKKIMIVTLALVLVLSFAACGGDNAKTVDEIVVGYIGPLTGESAIWGQTEANTLGMLVEEANANGGILGKKVVLKTYDNRGDAVETTNAARKAIQRDKVCLFFGPNTSSGCIALDEVCAEYKIPHITTTGTNYKVTQNDDGSVRPYSFRACLSDPQLGDVMAYYAYDKLNIKKCAILYEISSEYSLGITQNFTDSFEKAGGKITIAEAYKTGDVDFRAQLSKIKKNGDFEALMIPANYKEVGLIANQARALGIDQIFLGVDAWMMQDLFTVAKDAVQGSCFPCALDVNADNLNDFKQAYADKFGVDPDDAGTNAYLAYDCFIIVKNAIEKAGTADPEGIREQLEKTKDLQCLTSVVTINPDTHNPERSATMFKIEGDQFIKVDTYEFK